MSRLLVLVPVLMWLLWLDLQYGSVAAGIGRVDPMQVTLFLLGLVLLPLATGWIALRSVRLRVSRKPWLLRTSTPLLLTWHGIGLWSLDWGVLVQSLIGERATLVLPGVLLACGPTMLAWMAVVASEYPAFRAARSRQMMIDVERGLEPQALPSFRRWLGTRWRGLFLFALGSLAVVLLLKDAAVLTLAAFGIELSAGVQSFVFLGASLSIFILSPRLLVLLLPTWSLSEEARQRLKLVSDTAMLREPLVRVWNTHGSVMNAFAIGFIPRLRCVLLSDALLQNLRAEEIEAVYAHELGHMRHRHVAWYLLFFVTLLLLFSGPFFYVASMLFPANLDAVAIAWYWRVLDVTLSVGVIAGVLLGFGWLSRRFEREADVFAASTMQRRIDELADMPVSKGPGMLGASLFSQALYSAAGGVGPPRITGPGAWRKHLRRWRDWPRTISSSFLHGSVRDRATFLQHVASKPADLEHFRRRMFVLRIAMVATCVGSAMFLALS